MRGNEKRNELEAPCKTNQVQDATAYEKLLISVYENHVSIISRAHCMIMACQRRATSIDDLNHQMKGQLHVNMTKEGTHSMNPPYMFLSILDNLRVTSTSMAGVSLSGILVRVVAMSSTTTTDDNNSNKNKGVYVRSCGRHGTAKGDTPLLSICASTGCPHSVCPLITGYSPT